MYKLLYKKHQAKRTIKQTNNDVTMQQPICIIRCILYTCCILTCFHQNQPKCFHSQCSNTSHCMMHYKVYLLCMNQDWLLEEHLGINVLDTVRGGSHVRQMLRPNVYIFFEMICSAEKCA